MTENELVTRLRSSTRSVKSVLSNVFQQNVTVFPTLSLLGNYRIETNSIAAPVASGNIEYNNATQISATQLFISHLTDDNVDLDIVLALLKTGDVLIIQDKNESDNYQFWTISSTPSLASSTWTIPVTLSSSSGTGSTGFSQNHEVFLGRMSSTAATVKTIGIACSDETTALTAGTSKTTFRMPYAMTLSSVRANLVTAQSSGNIFTVDINKNGTSIISTKLTIDNNEKTSVTASTPFVFSTNLLNDDDEITIDIDQIGNSTAAGLKIWLIGT